MLWGRKQLGHFSSKDFKYFVFLDIPMALKMLQIKKFLFESTIFLNLEKNETLVTTIKYPTINIKRLEFNYSPVDRKGTNYTCV